MSRKVILGGPGCGKTTRLLQIMEQHLEDGVPPECIAYISFTKQAANEAKQRACQRFGFAPKRLPHFRTIHSFAFQMLHLRRSDVITPADFQYFGRETGLYFSRPTGDVFDLPQSRDVGDCVAYLDQMSRIQGRPVEQVLLDNPIAALDDVKYYQKCLHAFKEARGKLDFTDMLEQFLLSDVKVPELDVVIIDEGQDLSPLQWRVAEKICEHSPINYIGGDDDQSIFTWAGADVDYFLNLKGEKEVLPQSHRLPSKVFDVANKVISHVSKRYTKKWRPARQGGEVRHHSKMEYVDIKHGSWYILARNRFQLTSVTDHLKTQGYSFSMHGKHSVSEEIKEAILYWERLRKGQRVDGKNIKTVHRRFKTVYWPAGSLREMDEEASYTLQELQDVFGLTVTAPWMDVLRIATKDIEYIRNIRARGETLLGEPRIKVSTIHQAKGGEADHVALLTDFSRASYDGFKRNKDAEARVFYVGASRSRESLHIIAPKTNLFFPLTT